ncbi:MAG: hypothetical protein HXN28_11580 [Prevotella histicola]|nr:hypothetical protein [Prevotella histicola]MBF1393171.1 hypothetical protein [Prevotella histicola]
MEKCRLMGFFHRLHDTKLHAVTSQKTVWDALLSIGRQEYLTGMEEGIM